MLVTCGIYGLFLYYLHRLDILVSSGLHLPNVNTKIHFFHNFKIDRTGCTKRSDKDNKTRTKVVKRTTPLYLTRELLSDHVQGFRTAADLKLLRDGLFFNFDTLPK
jgi:hypothetical protein